MAYYEKTLRCNGGIIRRTAWGRQGEINSAPKRIRRTVRTFDLASGRLDRRPADR